MPLANKEVVHLKHGWEKIQVDTRRDPSLFFLSFFLSSSSSSFSFFLSKKNANRFLNRISKSAANCVLSARKLTRCIRSLSLSLCDNQSDWNTKAEKLAR